MDSENTPAETLVTYFQPEVTTGFKGVMFDPNIEHPGMAGYQYPVFDDYSGQYRADIRQALSELAGKGLNCICMFLCNLQTFKDFRRPNEAGQSVYVWGDLNYLDYFILFLEDCGEAGLRVFVDLVDNRWIPYSVDTKNHLGKKGGYWPVASDTPWEEAANWYSEIILYIEANVSDPNVIAAWGMQGNYSYGASEPKLWSDSNLEIIAMTEEFVKYVWPVFRTSGIRPKASPLMLPILADDWYWNTKTPLERLSAFTNLKKWLVDDLKLPPDYWTMTTYTYCDPANDGFHYLKKISEILSEGNDAKIISTDFKTFMTYPDNGELKGSIVYTPGKSRAEMLEWNLQKAREYDFAGWWMWSYQDEISEASGLRDRDGNWRDELVDVISRY